MTRLLVAALTLALGACTMVGPDYRRPAVELPAAYGEAGPQEKLGTVPVGWWALYGDNLLNGLIQSGLDKNSDLSQAVARIEEAEAALREARATLLFPLVNGQIGATRGTTVFGTTASTFSLGLSTSFEVDFWGGLRRAQRSIRAQLLASRHARDTVALTLAAAIARAYFTVRSLDSQFLASEEILRAADESLQIASKRENAGVGSALEVYQSGSQRAAAAAQSKEIARQRAVIVHQLGALTGRLDLVLPATSLDFLPIPPLPPPGLPSELLQRRPDVAQAEETLAAAVERIGVARAAQLPALQLTGSLGTRSTELGNIVSAGSKVWSIGVGLLGPVIDAGRFAARTEQAEAQARQAEAAFERTVRTAFREVSDALSNVRIAGEAEQDLQSRVDQARKALGLAQMRYIAGYSPYLEVLDAQRTLNDALLAFFRNRQAYLAFTVDLMNALGGGWQPPA